MKIRKMIVGFFAAGSALVLALTMGCGGGLDESQGGTGHQSGGDYWDLLHAIDQGDAAGVRKLVQSGADPNAATEGSPILSEAIWRGDAEILEALLEAGADPNATLDYGSHLYNAIRLDDVDREVRLKIVTALVGAGADVNWTDDAGYPEILLGAVRTEDPEVVRILIEARADPRTEPSRVPLLSVVKNEEIARMLVEAGAPRTHDSHLTLAVKEPPEYFLMAEYFSVIDRTSDSLTIHWDAAWDPDGTVTFHELHRAQSEMGAYEAVASTDAADSTFVDPGLEPDSVYYYRVRACNDSGCTGFSKDVAAGVTEALGQVAIPPAPVSWMSGARIDDDEVMGIWAQVPGATYYEIQGSFSATTPTYPGQETEVSAPRGSHLFVPIGDWGSILGVTSPSVIQTFRIRACNKAGCSPFEPARPWPVSEKNVLMVGPCQLGLRLNPGEGCYWDGGDTVFHIGDKAHSGIHYMCVGNRKRSMYTCDDLYVEIGEDFIAAELESSREWLIRRHPLSQLEPQDSASVKPPDEPRSLEARSQRTQIILSWQAPLYDGGSRLTGYRIEVSEDGSNWDVLLADTGPDTSGYTHGGLIGGGTRFYRVSAINSAGIGQQSSVASASTELCGGYKSLSTAISHMDVEGVRCLIEELDANVNETDIPGKPMLFWAILEESPEIVRLLVDAGADVNATDDLGNPLLSWAMNAENPEILRLLVDAGADVNATDDLGNPMLFWAIMEENPELVKLLVDAGADVNAADNFGRKPIHSAQQAGNAQILQILIEAGATE